MRQHPVLRAASLRLLTASLVSSACGCAEPAPTTTAHERTAGSAPSSGGGDDAPVAGDPAEPPPPERLSAVIYLGTADGAHLDVVVTAAGETWTISGVRADNTRADPVPRMIELTEAERRDYAARIHALGDMPRCEPMGRREGEPLFTLRFRHANGLDVDTTEPCVWLRADAADDAALADPCMAYVRIAQLIHSIWVSRYPEA